MASLFVSRIVAELKVVRRFDWARPFAAFLFLSERHVGFERTYLKLQSF
jgi:hypothetical protein